MKLFYAPAACSLGPHIVAHEAGLNVEFNKVTFGADGRTTADGRDFYTINPQGAVPALELDNGEVLAEAQVILQYLASLAPAKNLAPSEGMARWKLLETLNFIATELHKGTSPLFKKPSPEVRDATVKNLEARYQLLERKLGDKEFLQGAFTIADAYAFVVLNWARRFEVNVGPKLTAYFERVRARPAVQRALQEEGLPTS